MHDFNLDEIELPANIAARPRKKFTIEIEYIPLDDDERFLSPISGVKIHIDEKIKTTEVMCVTGAAVGAMASVLETSLTIITSKKARESLQSLHFSIAEAINDEQGKFIHILPNPKGL